jgi:hypothetical protein
MKGSSIGLGNREWESKLRVGSEMHWEVELIWFNILGHKKPNTEGVKNSSQFLAWWIERIAKLFVVKGKVELHFEKDIKFSFRHVFEEPMGSTQ